MTCKWKPNPKESVPRHAVQVIPVDPKGRFLTMHRSNNVRSAKNVWSFPSGLHDIGEPLVETARRELEEEYALASDPEKVVYLGVYENIAGDTKGEEQYHWVITMLAVKVIDCELAINKEPDKHDQMRALPLLELVQPDFFQQFTMHQSIMTWATPEKRLDIARQLSLLVQRPIIDVKRFEAAPCYICGHNSGGYYQPASHRCAEVYHMAIGGKL